VTFLVRPPHVGSPTPISFCWRAGRRLAFVVVLAALVAACGDKLDLSANDYIQQAREQQLQGKLRASVISLKNALQKDPQSAAARLLIGQIYVDLGLGAQAEKELVRAQTLGIDRQTIVKPLGLALLLQGDNARLLETIRPSETDGPSIKAVTLVLRGRALTGLGRLDEAEDALTQAQKLNPKAPDVHTALARLAIAQRDLARGEAELAQAEKIAPTDPDVLAVQGDISFLRGDFATSESAFADILKTRTNNLRIRASLARAQIGAGKLDEAIKNLDRVLKAIPSHPSVNYLRAVAAYETGDYQGAIDRLEVVFKAVPSHLPSLLMAGAANFATGRFEQANRFLSRFLALVPNHADARKLLASTQLRLGRPAEAEKTLSPLVAQGDENDASVLAMIGQAAVQTGDMAAGSRYFQKAVQLSPKNAVLRANLGLVRLALGEPGQGVEDLEQAVEIDPGTDRNEYILILGYIRAKRFDDAIKAAKRLQEKEPDNATWYTLAGLAYFSKKNNKAARKAFAKAFEIAPGRIDAGNNLAMLAESAGDLDAARGYLEKVLKKHPTDLRTSLRLARIEAKAGLADESISRLVQTVEDQPNSMFARLFLGRAYLRTGKAEKAAAVAEEGLRSNPSDPGLLEIAGRAYLATDRADDAAAVFRRLTETAPNAAEAQFLLGKAYISAGNLNAAVAAFKAAVAIDGRHVRARIMLARSYLDEGRSDEAIPLLDALAKDLPNNLAVTDLRGRAALLAGRFTEAISFFRKEHEAKPTSESAARLALAQWRAGDRPGAIATLEARRKDNADDLVIRFQLASYYQALDRLDDARAVLAEVVALTPDNAIAHNDLAWVLLRKGDTTSAVKHARRAQELARDDGNIMDTLGLALLESGDAEGALRVLRDAVAKLPDRPDIAFHLARALAKTGRTEEARGLLEKLLAQTASFSERNAARAFLDRLSP